MSIEELIQEEARYAKTVEETKIKAKNIMANAEKEAEKIIEKASRITSDKGPDGDFDD